ncbi:MAG: energy transducer TonB [bacterium]
MLEYRIIYPDVARQMGLEGRVVLAVLINENGTVDQVRISKTSSSPILDSAATETARTFVFSPALMGDRPVKIWVKLPVEFKFEEVKPGEWLQEVKNLQKIIEKNYREEKVMDLYKLYKKLIFSPRKTIDISVNEYIKAAVLDTTAKLWDGYWQLYPAMPILFFDIIYRYPQSYARFEAEQEFREFFEREIISIRNTLPTAAADSLIRRLR